MDLYWIAPLIVVIVLYAIWKRWQKFRLFKSLGVPGPKPSSWPGETADVMERREFMLENCKKYGSVWGYYEGHHPILVVTDLEMIKQLVTQFSNFQSPWSFLKTTLGSEKQGVTDKDICDTMDIEEVSTLLNESVEHTLKLFEKRCIKERAFDICGDYQKMANAEFISRHVSEIHFTSFKPPYIEDDRVFFKFAMSFVVRFLCVIPGVQGIILYFRPTRKLYDWLTSDWKQLECELGKRATMLLGLQTSAYAMGVLWGELALNHDVQEKLQQEIDQHYSGGGYRPNYETVHKLTYLNMVIQEFFRLHPISHARIIRLCETKCQIGGYTIPAGTCVIVYPEHIHMNPRIWGPEDPRLFVPERFSAERSLHRDPAAWIPFGIAPCHCVGMRFAVAEIKIMMARTLHQYSIRRCDDIFWLPVKADEVMVKIIKRSNVSIPDCDHGWEPRELRVLSPTGTPGGYISPILDRYLY